MEKWIIISVLWLILILVTIFKRGRYVVPKSHFSVISIGIEFNVDEIDLITNKKTYCIDLHLVFFTFYFIPEKNNDIVHFVSDSDLIQGLNELKCSYYIDNKKVTLDEFLAVTKGYHYEYGVTFLINNKLLLAEKE